MVGYWGSKDSTSRLTGNQLLCVIGTETQGKLVIPCFPSLIEGIPTKWH